MESNIYNYEDVKGMMQITKKDLKPNDLLLYKNGEQAILYEQYYWAIMKFYDNDLNNVYNDGYTIMQVLRPHYEKIYDRDADLQKRK